MTPDAHNKPAAPLPAAEIPTRHVMTPEEKRSQITLACLYLAAMALGVANGLWGGEMLQQIAQIVSSIFIRLFKFISIPIIAVSIIATLASISQSSDSGKIFRRSIFYTLFTTILAATLAAVLFVVFSPANVAISGSSASLEGVAPKQSYLDYVQTVIPDNFLAPFLSANVLSVLLISAAVGIAIAKLPSGSRPQEVLMAFFSGLQSVLCTIVGWIIKALPIGLFGFFTVLTTELASGVAIGGLGSYFGAVLSANFIQMLVILPLVLLARGLNPIRVARGMFPALMVAFFSKSSAGTLPVTMACAEKLGVRKPVSRFVLPICTTINMNGCAAFILITVVYLMQNAGADITVGTLAAWILISTIAAVGNAGVPMGCFFLSASLLASMNVPILLIGVILPFYAVIDAIETTLNVWSDSAVAAMVNKDMYGDKL